MFPAHRASHTESHGVKFTSPFRTSRRAQKPQKVFSGAISLFQQPHCSLQSFRPPSLHFREVSDLCSPFLLTALEASSKLPAGRYPNHETTCGRPTSTISLLAYYSTWLHFGSLASTPELPSGSHSGQDVWKTTASFALCHTGFPEGGNHIQKPKPSHCNLQLHRVLWHLAMANTVSFAPKEQRSPCGFAERQPTASGGSRPNTPQRPSQDDRPHLLEASGLPGRLIRGSACGKARPIPLVLGVEFFLIGALKPIGICSSRPGPVAVGSPSDEGHHYSWFRIIYLACSVFSLLVFC